MDSLCSEVDDLAQEKAQITQVIPNPKPKPKLNPKPWPLELIQPLPQPKPKLKPKPTRIPQEMSLVCQTWVEEKTRLNASQDISGYNRNPGFSPNRPSNPSCAHNCPCIYNPPHCITFTVMIRVITTLAPSSSSVTVTNCHLLCNCNPNSKCATNARLTG